jgi:outer membrane protein TolC
MMLFIFSLILNAQAAPTNFFIDLENFKTKSLTLDSEIKNLGATSDLLLSKKLFWTPRLSVSASQIETRLNSEKVGDSNYATADLSLNVFRGGSDLNSLAEAKALQKAQEFQVLNEALRVEVKASDLIFKSLYLNESLHIQEQVMKLKEESLRIVKDRYQQGKLPQQEVTKSEVDLSLQKNKLRSARLDLIENKTQVNALFISVIQTQTWPFNEKVKAVGSPTKKIPLIEQKYWLSQSSEESWKSLKGSHWPSLDISLQYQVSPIKEPSNQQQQLVGLVSLTLPIWDQYITSAKISSANARRVTALNEFKDTEQTLKQKTLFLKEKIENFRQNLIEAKNNLEISRKLYQDILRSFRLGRISTNDLFVEQNRLLESENNLALSQLTFHQSLIETCALAGLKSIECLQ